jgi:4-oxalocrotonate tautomerase
VPIITIEGPALSGIGGKRKLAREITTLAAEAYGLPESTMTVIIRENPPENVAVSGRLLADADTSRPQQRRD